jgi:arylformamidase
MKIIDLSVLLSADTPVYPGDPATKLEKITTVEQDGVMDHYLSTDTHTGTHIDAPAHMIAGAKTLGQLPIDHFVGPGKYIEVIDNQFDLEAVKAADIQAGDIVLFHTGMSDYYGEDRYWTDRPAMSEEIAQYLVNCQAKMVGLDTGSADAKGSGNHPIHKILLGGEVLIIENMTNLASLADKRFTVYALPLKLDVDGAPTRAIAAID